MDDTRAIWQNIFQLITPARQRFSVSLVDPAQAQLACLLDILTNNAETVFGKKFGFHTIQSIASFQQSVPIGTYEAHSSYIKGMISGTPDLLLQESVSFYEQTGGTSQGTKLIPYTQTSLLALQGGLHPWLVDLLTQHPQIMEGTSYWAISPLVRRHTETKNKTPIGIGNDAYYFGTELANLLCEVMCIPPFVNQLSDLSHWQYVTIRSLLGQQDLSFISIWSPTFLIDLIHYLDLERERLLYDIQYGKVSISVSSELKNQLLSCYCADPSRAASLYPLLTDSGIDTHGIWPTLNSISCWSDASAGDYARQLQQIFPSVTLQGKGLLATEAIITIPWQDAKAPVLCVNSGFYEFQDSRGHAHACDDLIEGDTYRVLVTTYGGLYRYDLGDLVRFEGWHGHAPMLRFLGRDQLTTDMCGEKLTEAFVHDQLRSTTGFAAITPHPEKPRGYLLILDSAHWCEEDAQGFANRIDQRLCKNSQYDYARQLQQLSSITPIRVEAAWQHYRDFCLSRGLRLGDIKTVSLISEHQWLDYLRAHNCIGGGKHG